MNFRSSTDIFSVY